MSERSTTMLMDDKNHAGDLRKTPFSLRSPNEISSSNPEELAAGGFCFLVAELLKAKFPQAELWRLTNREGTTFAHVFVRIDGEARDVKGFRSVDEMRFDLDDRTLVEKITNAQAVQDFFHPLYTPEQLAAGRAVLSKYLERQLGALRPYDNAV